MAYVVVTVEYDQKRMDLALPMHMPSRLVVEGVMEILKINKRRGQTWVLGLKTEQGIRRIPTNAKLGDSNVLHGAVLTLLQEEGKAVVQTGAFLSSEDGQTFPLAAKMVTIGRNDPKSGIFVDIDLNTIAREPKAISRRHAQIEQDGDRFYVTDLGSANGTKLNGQRIPSKEKKPIWEGDVIELGRGAAHLTFFAGEKN
jgi:uncharacterized ubiquitin-like protein YukD